MEFAGSGARMRPAADLGGLRRQRTAGLHALAGEWSDGDGQHHAGRHHASPVPSDCRTWFHGEHHAGAQRAANRCWCRPGLGNGGDRVSAEIRAKCGVHRAGDQRTRDPDGNWRIRKSIELEFDYTNTDVDAGSHCAGHALSSLLVRRYGRVGIREREIAAIAEAQPFHAGVRNGRRH